MIRQQTVPFTELNLPALVRDYLLGEDNVKPFVDAFPDRSALEQRIQRRQFSDDYRKRLKSVLTRQYQGLEGEVVWNNINSLDKTNTLTICTGHQLALATGPLYVIYKISSVIALTRKLNSDFPDKHFVPVFWMATEDHDFAEINHLSIGDKMINWASTQSGATGQFCPDEGLQRALLEMKEALGANEEAESMMQLLRSAYAQPTLADATRTLMHGLFSQYGLVCIDANESELKKIFAPVVKRELFEKVTAGNVEKTNRELRHRGYAPQVNA
ncbi:MAG: bacillithiol biosynthesis BshC, partial [Flavobacteriales bacterium]|nr:bacillithiol biosynthesis BshC [Flavobacteriales bacterium]